MTQCCPFCDEELPGPDATPRSYEQLKLYMGGIKAAFAAWPETEKKQFYNITEFRWWLQCMAEYGEVKSRIPASAYGIEAAREQAKTVIRETGGKGIPIVRGSELLIVVPKSIKFEKLSQKKFQEVYDNVDRIVIERVGRSMKELVTGDRWAA